MAFSKIMKIKDIYNIFNKPDKEIIDLLHAENLLQPLKICSKCRTMCFLDKNTDYKGNYATYCKKCKKYRSLTPGTFFETTQISFEDFFIILWMWASHASVKVTCNLTGIAKEHVIQYFRYIRDICSWKLVTSPARQIGGEGHIVQIDESVVAKRKYNRGKKVKETWVLGMIDVETRESVIRYVQKRDAATMIPIIQQHVKPGTTIWSDCWRAYNQLGNLGYIHETVNHSTNFKSEKGVCTNLIEGHWKCLKQHCRIKNVLQSKFLFEYVDEFMWVQQYGKDVTSKFNNMLSQIKERYPL